MAGEKRHELVVVNAPVALGDLNADLRAIVAPRCVEACRKLGCVAKRGVPVLGKQRIDLAKDQAGRDSHKLGGEDAEYPLYHFGPESLLLIQREV